MQNRIRKFLMALTRIFLIVIFQGGVAPQDVFGKETDQFTDRDIQMRMLPDSGLLIDGRVGHLIDKLVDRFNAHLGLTDDQRVDAIEAAFQSSILPADLFSPLEDWLSNHAVSYAVSYRGIFGGAVNYDDMALAWYVDLSPSIQIDHVIFGNDKVGHFFGTSWSYYKRYRELQKNSGLGEEELLEKIRDFGHLSETSVAGLEGDGVYSFGDLAANWQGFRFFQSLMQGPRPYIQRLANGSFAAGRRFLFREYVVEDFDEVINPSMLMGQQFYNHVTANFRSSRPSICELYHRNPARFQRQSSKRLERREYMTQFMVEHYETLPYVLRISEICR